MKINSTTAKHIKKYCHIIGLLSFLIAFFVCSQMIRYQEKEKRAAGTYILMSIQNMKAIRTEIRAGREDLKVISIITI